MKKTKRLIFAAFVLALSLAMTVTSTFAWFIRGANPEISSFELEALSYVPNLLISLNQSDVENEWKTTDGYKTTWTTDEFFEALEGIDVDKKGDKTVEAKLGAYTTDDGINFTDEADTMENNEVGEAGSKKTIFNNAANNDDYGSVLQFKIRFRSDSKNLRVALHNDAGLTAKKITSASKPVFTWNNDEETTTNFDPDGFGINRIAVNGTSTPLSDSEAAGRPVYLSSAYAARLSFAQTLNGPIGLQELTLAELKDQNNLNAIKTAIQDYLFTVDEDDYTTTGKTISSYFLGVSNADAFDAAWTTYWGAVITAIGDVETAGENASEKIAALNALLPAEVLVVVSRETAAKIWNPQATNSINDDANINSTLSTANYYVIDDVVDARMNTSANTGGAAAATTNFADEYKKTIISRSTAAGTPAPNGFTARGEGGVANLQGNEIVRLNQSKDFNGVTYYFGEITLNIWLEGWDTSCTNSILSDVFGVSLKFTSVTGA